MTYYLIEYELHKYHITNLNALCRFHLSHVLVAPAFDLSTFGASNSCIKTEVIRRLSMMHLYNFVYSRKKKICFSKQNHRLHSSVME